MVVRHRGYTIEAHREMSLGGWPTLYWSIFHGDEEMASGFEDSNETEADMVELLRQRVDAEIKDGEWPVRTRGG